MVDWLSDSKKRKEEPELTPLGQQRFDKALATTVLLWLPLILLIFIPYGVGPMLVFTFVPYFVGTKGGRYVSGRYAIEVGIIAAVICSIIELYIIFSLLSTFEMPGEAGIHTRLDLFIVVSIFLLNIVFCVLGTFFKRKDSTPD